MGHLLDIPRYLSTTNSQPLPPLDDSTPITVELLDGCIAFQGNDIQPGDILLVRTGWQEAFEAVPMEERLKIRNQSTGIKRGTDMLRWHWDKKVAAVASDV
jgi:kynurenine formamidase